MKEKFGDKVKFIRIKDEKGFIKSLFGMSDNKTSLPDDVLKSIETRSEWGRFGL
jgi:hypothetical protein